MSPMGVPSHADAFEVLVLQAADNGRGPMLFGDGKDLAVTAARPFMVGRRFPSVYLEFPLTGKPFLDVTVLYNEVEPGLHIESDGARGADGMLDWFSGIASEYEEVSCGFELDTCDPTRVAALHFQPRAHKALVRPFCESVGEPQAARLYLELVERMPEGWPLSFFGMFRGRPGAPLRVCGYLDNEEKDRCAHDRACLSSAFEQIGFVAYDDAMLCQVSELMATAPSSVDFQFDVYPDTSIGSTFAIDVQFKIAQAKDVISSFESGPASRVMSLLETWGVADERWRLCVEATFARGINVVLDDGAPGRYYFSLMPQWVKARWTDGRLMPSKMYYLGSAGVMEALPHLG